MRYADVLIAQTKEMADRMTSFYNVRRNKIAVIHNPVDTSLIKESICEKYDFGEINCTHYIAVGRIAPQKDYMTLLKAFAEVQRRKPRSRLHIIGTCRVRKNQELLDDYIRESELTGLVTFHGFQQNPYKYMEAADVFVLSSVYEGLPNVMLEAMYLGKPVVVTRSIPYISQVVHDGINGYTVSVGKYNELAEAMMKASELHIAERFVDINNNEEQIVRLFDTVFSHGK